MWFISSLMLATSAAALYEKLESVSEEGAIACVAIGLISAVTTLFAAPWQIHLILVLVILALRFHWFSDLSRWHVFDFIPFTSEH
ncbi:MAG: hypothetical protein F6K30_05365 [Cyanothece sp. SIO2G6]|nr:hypothetical protein [Cyanothece sp. SIO2G6]